MLTSQQNIRCFLLVLAVICPLPAFCQNGPRNFIVTAPSRFGSRETICITLSSLPANVSVSLLSQKSDDLLSIPLEKVVTDSYECLEIKVDDLPDEDTTARLLVRVTLPNEGGVYNTMRNVTLAPDPVLTFISTDKPIYGAKQVIRIRIFSVSTEFLPLTEKGAKIWLENPQGVHIAQWKNVESSRGFIDLNYQLVDNPYPGTWTVKVKIRGREESKSFLVQKEAQTTFQVHLSVPDAAEENSKINISVCARYAFDKAVSGNANVNVTVECPFTYYCSENATTESVTQWLDDAGCAGFSVTVDAGKQSVWRSLRVKADVQEEGTNQVYSSERRVKIIPVSSFNSVVSEFKLRSRRIKPGLPFEGKLLLSVRRRPVEETDVTFCARLEEAAYCKVGRTINGTIPFVLFVPKQQMELGEKVLVDVSWKYNNTEETKKSLYLQPWFSPSGNYLQIRTSQNPILCGSKFAVEVLHTMPGNNLKYYVMVKSRGRIMLFDALDKMDNLLISDFKFKSEDVVVLRNNPSTEAIKSISFSLPIRSVWSPFADLIIYTVLENGDVVADSINLAIEECFSYNVSAAWSKNETTPSSNIELKITTNAPSTCALTVVNKKVQMLSQRLPKIKDELFHKLKEVTKLHERGKRNSGACVNESVVVTPLSSNLSLMPDSSSAFADSVDAFEDSGLLVMSDLPIAVKPCKQPVLINPRLAGNELDANEALFASDIEENSRNSLFDSSPEFDYENSIQTPEPEVTMRSNFVDTWLFGLYDVQDNDVNITTVMPDSLTEWTAEVSCMSSSGLSIAEPATIRSFQPFFVEFSLPPTVKRHELLHIPISVFNYLESSIPVMISLEPSEHFHIKEELSKSVCVESGSKATQIFKVLAVKLGAANISVKAEIDPFNSEDCGPALNAHYKMDYVMKEIAIRGEGRRLEEIRSALICGDETRFAHSSYSNFVDWTMKMSSPDYVDHTVIAEARVSGDIFGPPLLNVEKLLNLPTSTGDQNMLTFAVNVLLVKYLLAKHRGPDVAPHDTKYVTRALKNLDSGYQQQLSFRHNDGSYSLFGPYSSNSSIWLTALVARYFTEARLYIHLDESDLLQSVQWLKIQQLENGCFPMLGDVEHWDAKRRQTARDSPKALTSYILISILKANLTASSSLVKNAVFCLQASDIEDVYADLLTVYALALANETRDATWKMKGLLQVAQRSYQMLWWQTDESSTEASIEMTSYGILALLHLGGPHFLGAAADAVRWLLQYQNQNGGFLSTQDTLLAIEALAAYSDILPPHGGSLQVSLSYQGGNDSFTINEENRLVQQVSTIPPFLTNIHFEAFGSGCSLVQTVLGYNVRRGVQSKTLKLHLKVEPVSSIDETIRKVELCAKTKAPLPTTGMAVIEFMLPTGYFPDRTSLYQVTSFQKGVIKWEEYEENLNFYLENVTHQKKCLTFLLRREICVDNPSSIIAKVYDFYNSKHYTAVKHNIQQTCNTTDTWLQSGNTIGEVNPRQRRDTKTENAVGSVFSNFMDVDQDLDVPSDNGNPVAVFALPPPSTNGSNHKCPQCFAAPQDIFGKLYCSSKLAAQIRVRGRHLLEVLQDLSPGRTSNNLRNTIAYTVKQRCQCDILDSGDSTAFVLVTPPRFFNLRTVQVIHLDDSFALFPWNATSQFESTYFSPTFSCNEMLSVNR